MKPILINKNDFGMILKTQLTDNNKQKINLVNTTLSVIIIYPDRTEHPCVNVSILDVLNGLVEITLIALNTAQIGDYSVYVGISNEGFSIFSTSPITYTVKAR